MDAAGLYKTEAQHKVMLSLIHISQSKLITEEKMQPDFLKYFWLWKHTPEVESPEACFLSLKTSIFPLPYILSLSLSLSLPELHLSASVASADMNNAFFPVLFSSSLQHVYFYPPHFQACSTHKGLKSLLHVTLMAGSLPSVNLS